jgi:hypothetical protein
MQMGGQDLAGLKLLALRGERLFDPDDELDAVEHPIGSQRSRPAAASASSLRPAPKRALRLD